MTTSDTQKNIGKVSDLGYLSETMGGNRKLIKEIMGVFLKQAPEELTALNEAMKRSDCLTIRNISHTMKSSVSIMGITSLASVLKEMEELSKDSKNLPQIAPLNDALNTICSQAIEEIKQEMTNYI